MRFSRARILSVITTMTMVVFYFKPNETFDGQPHIFKFEIVTDDKGDIWYKYIGVK